MSEDEGGTREDIPPLPVMETPTRVKKCFHIGTLLSLGKSPATSLGPKGSRICIPKGKSVPDNKKSVQGGGTGVWGLPSHQRGSGRLTPVRGHERNGEFGLRGERSWIRLQRSRPGGGAVTRSSAENEEDQQQLRKEESLAPASDGEAKVGEAEIRLRMYCVAWGVFKSKHN